MTALVIEDIKHPTDVSAKYWPRSVGDESYPAHRSGGSDSKILQERQKVPDSMRTSSVIFLLTICYQR